MFEKVIANTYTMLYLKILLPSRVNYWLAMGLAINYGFKPTKDQLAFALNR